MCLSKRTKLISPSITLEITAKAKKMKKDGIDVIGFGAGEPDFDTPDYIKEEAKKSLDAGFTKYTPASGMPELKKAVCDKLKRDNDLDYNPQEIIISCGAKHSLYNAMQVLCEEGDEVILLSPYWVSYLEQIKVAGAKPVIVETTEENGFKITPEQFNNAITSRTKLLILNSPNNPTGAVYTREELQWIANILVESNIFCISDEIYEKLVYENTDHVSIASLCPGMKRLAIVINGLSKAYSMTGWRIGYAAAPEKIIKAMSNLQSHSTSNPTSFCQAASILALNKQDDSMAKMKEEFSKRRDYIVERLNSIKDISCINPEGAFYVFPKSSKLYGKSFKDCEIRDSISLSKLLLEKANIAVVPGSAFGADNYLRLSYATSMENIIKGMDRLEKFVNSL